MIVPVSMRVERQPTLSIKLWGERNHDQCTQALAHTCDTDGPCPPLHEPVRNERTVTDEAQSAPRIATMFTKQSAMMMYP